MEYLLETYSEGVTRRFSISKKEYLAIISYNQTDDVLDSIWEFTDIKGGYVSLDMRKLTGFRLYKREVKIGNPMELDEHYDNPLS